MERRRDQRPSGLAAAFSAHGHDFFLLLLLGGGRHGIIHFAVDDFKQGDIGPAHVGGFIDQGVAAAAVRQLPHAPGYEVHQNVGVADFRQGLLYVFAFQEIFKVTI